MQYTTTITWKHASDAPFTVKTYDRTHHITFPGGASLDASSAPEFLGNRALPNPEELFTASLSSCFMLTFLYWAAMKGLSVAQYSAEASGTLGKNAEGKMCMTEITIKPVITLQNNQAIDPAMLEELFKKAHDNCFISSSIKTKVIVQSEQTTAA